MRELSVDAKNTKNQQQKENIGSTIEGKKFWRESSKGRARQHFQES